MPPYTKLSDHQLASLIKAGDVAAFTEIYDRYWEELLRSAYRVLKEKDACMDVLQEVFVWYWTHRENLMLNSIKAYLLVAVKYQVANYIRSSKVRLNYVKRTELLNIEQAYDDHILEIKEFKALLAHFTAELPERCREIFNLSRNEYLTNKEISSKLGISEKTVEMQITIALKRLRLKMGKYSAHLFFLF